MERYTSIPINNAYFDELDEKWYGASDHPVALLRAGNELRNPWIQQVLNEKVLTSSEVLDIGCGGGFLTHYLAEQGHQVKGIDLSEQSLEMARKLDPSGKVEYTRASAYALPYPDESFDVCTAMDLLEHVESPGLVIKEAGRVLRKGGLFFFHTFNRNPLTYLLVIKGLEWCFSNVPPRIHTHPLFIKPKELKELCENHSLEVKEMKGVRPDFSNQAFLKMVFQRKVAEDFGFVSSRSLSTGYSGYAQKI